jgi:hypothetical protein
MIGSKKPEQVSGNGIHGEHHVIRHMRPRRIDRVIRHGGAAPLFLQNATP